MSAYRHIIAHTDANTRDYSICEDLVKYPFEMGTRNVGKTYS